MKSGVSSEGVGAQVLGIVRALVAELHPNLVDPRRVRLYSDLDRDLALNSLSRAELLMRLNRRFKVKLPEALLGAASSPADLVKAVVEAAPSVVESSVRIGRETGATEAVEEPIEAATLIETLHLTESATICQHRRRGRSHAGTL